MLSQQSLKIKFHKVVAIFELMVSAFAIYVGLRGGTSSMIVGFVLLVLGIKTLTAPVIVITTVEVEMRNLLGMVLKRHAYQPEEVSVRGNLVYIQEQKIFSTVFYDVNPTQVKAFFAQFQFPQN